MSVTVRFLAVGRDPVTISNASNASLYTISGPLYRIVIVNNILRFNYLFEPLCSTYICT